MILRATILLTLIFGIWNCADAQSSIDHQIFIECDGLDADNYAKIKTAFSQNAKLSLESVSIQGQLLCVEGTLEEKQLWVESKRLLTTILAESNTAWRSDLTREDYIAISRSYRLTPSPY